MDKIGRPHNITGKTALECLKKIPVMRGCGGYKPVGKWVTVGTGINLELIRMKEKEIGFENFEDTEKEWKIWEEILTKEFVSYLRGNKFIYYLCPHCNSHI
jgi:hypothetical protein